jgi:hypothetical protein
MGYGITADGDIEPHPKPEVSANVPRASRS